MINQIVLKYLALVALSMFHGRCVTGQECSRVDYTQDACRSENTITVAGQVVNKGSSDVRLKLPGSQTETEWFCGTTKERVAWGTSGNQLRVNYVSDGTVQWTIYLCEELSGPTNAGDSCGVQLQNAACPKFTDDSPSCVYELTTSVSTSRTTSTTVSGEVAAEARTEAGITGSVSVGVEHTVSDAKIVTVSQGTYLVIPAGFSYCSYTEGTSVVDVLAPTGFSWQCSFTKFKQAMGTFSNPSSCVNLRQCDVGVCGSAAGDGVVPLLSTTVALSCLSLFAIVLYILN